MTKRIFEFPASYEPVLEAELSRLGYSLQNPQALAKAVVQLSDFYIENPTGQTPWTEKWAQAASLAYYFPLNYARNQAVAVEAQRLGFFSGIHSLLDVGAGMGSGLHAFADQCASKQIKFDHLEAHDFSREALDLCEALELTKGTLKTRVDRIEHRVPPTDLRVDFDSTLLLASYVFTELLEAPLWWREIEALAIIEPSTQSDARKLQAFRDDLIEAGFQIWAPCTHMQNCPLLLHSKKDWCHDRIHWNAPAWFTEMEKSLPMKNRTLTFSYLLARKTMAPPTGLKGLSRLIGDTLVEKGKTRQAVCRSSDREFLAWFPQRFPKGTPLIELQRGNLLSLEGELEKRADEVRIKEVGSLHEIPPSETIQ